MGHGKRVGAKHPLMGGVHGDPERYILPAATFGVAGSSALARMHRALRLQDLRANTMNGIE